jgi:hypothetical protein
MKNSVLWGIMPCIRLVIPTWGRCESLKQMDWGVSNIVSRIL